MAELLNQLMVHHNELSAKTGEKEGERKIH